jgi:hypothetical protein
VYESVLSFLQSIYLYIHIYGPPVFPLNLISYTRVHSFYDPAHRKVAESKPRSNIGYSEGQKYPASSMKTIAFAKDTKDLVPAFCRVG